MRTRWILLALGGATLGVAAPATAQVTMPEGITGQSLPPGKSVDTLIRDDPAARRNVPPSVYAAEQARADGAQDVKRPRVRERVPQANSRAKTRAKKRLPR